jgi:rubrerythrin
MNNDHPSANSTPSQKPEDRSQDTSRSQKYKNANFLLFYSQCGYALPDNDTHHCPCCGARTQCATCDQ